MKDEDLQAVLDQLISGWENEVVEFKEAGNDFDTDKIGRYFSALSNEANIHGQERGWLVFGVENRNRTVVGSSYRTEPERLKSLMLQVSQSTQPSVTFRNVHVLNNHKGRVILFEIPAAPLGIPIAWKQQYYARVNDSLTGLGFDKMDRIRAQTAETDWSAQIVPEATIGHLDLAALSRARENFARKYANRFPEGEVKGWPEITFLDRARLTTHGKISRTALLLLGRSDAAHLLSPHPAQMTWRLEGSERAYQHFGPPFLLNSTALYKKIRNVQMRILPDDELLPVEVAKYDQKIVLEALHNCIAHQDYRRNGRIVVTEEPDQLIFENEGSFFEGSPADYLDGHKTPRRYRSPFLAQAMAELNMIDTMGYGIREMFIGQKKRFFPMPDYDLSNLAVKVTLYGRVVDPAYSRTLIQKTDLSLIDVLSLDRVQKRLPLDDETARRLKKARLIEGRKPNFHVSAAIANATETRAAYIRTRALDDGFYRKLITEYLEQFNHASRADIDRLLMGKLSDALDGKQRITKIGNLLTSMRKAGVIQNLGGRGIPRWTLVKKNEKE